MLQEIKEQKEIITHRKICDVCGAEIKRDMACSVAKCEYCGKDLCEKCIEHEDSDCGDYRTVFCKSCWDIGKDYLPKIEAMEAQIESLYEEWQNKCRASRAAGFEPDAHYSITGVTEVATK